MTTRISTNNLDSSVTASFSPKISGIAIADNTYTALDDTAVSVSGGYIIISGSNFASGCTVLIGSVVATSVSFINSTTVRAQVPAQAAGSYTVYLTNPDGGVALRINGLNYSATPTWSTTSPLPTGQINSAISIQLSATSNGNVTYALQAGSTLPSGLTLSNVGLLSGTVTGITSDTTYNFTVVAIDAELQDTPQAFSITITSNDQYFKNTTLLLSANTPGATFITDASTNAFNVSVFGDTRPNTFGPYTPGYYSNFFDGNGDYLSFPASAAMAMGTGDYTIEFWIYLIGTGDFTVIDNQGSGGNMQISRIGGVLYHGSASTWSYTFTNNTWTHIAFAREGTNLRLFANGVLQQTQTNSNSIGSAANTNTIGVRNDAFYPLNGHLSNLRVVKGTAVYTANFTPSATPLTAITNTSLLTCQSNRFIDNSTNNFSITRNGDVRVTGFVPYTPAVGTSTYGSGYFDGTGDYLSLGNNDAFNCGTGNFTLECWYFHDGGTALYPSIFSSTDWATGTGGLGLRFNNTGLGNKFGFFWYGVGDPFLTASFTSDPYAWHHVALTRSGNNFTLWVDGVSAATGTASGTVNWNLTTGGPRIGWGPWDGNNGYLKAYISDLRLVKGTALYSATFTPPTAPLTAVANTSLLTLQTNQPVNNNQFVDRSTSNFLITRGGNVQPGSFSPYAGGWSNYFDGSGDSLTVPANAAFSFGTGDFTVEFWAYYPPVSNTNGKMVVDARPTATNGSYWNFGVTNAGIMAFTTMTIGGATVSDTATRSNQWVHYAVSRSGTSLRLFANGTQVASATNSDNISSSGLFIGTNAFSGTAADTFYLGYISNLRIVKGTALYTANFTPPTQPLTAVTNTSLLTCADSRFVDDSANNFTLTRNGDVSVQKFSPFSMQTQIVPTSYSVYFDGNGDFLDAGTNAALGFGTGDFTVEAWIYRSASGTFPIYTNGPASAGSWAVYVLSDKLQTDYYGGTSLAGATNIPLNTWNHVAVIRSGSTLSLYLNGSRDATTTTSSNNSTSNGVVGRDWTNASGYSNGFISNLRVVKGTAIYTGTTYTVPTQPLTAVANTSLLTCQSTTIRDNSTNAFAITVNGNSRPLPVNPFGYTNPAAGAYTTTALGGSMYFDGTGDYLDVPDNTNLLFGASNFTIEAWFYTTKSGEQTIISKLWQGSPVYASYVLYIETGNTLRFLASTSGGAWEIDTGSSTATVVRNTWCHVAVVRNGSTFSLYINGALDKTATNSGTLLAHTGVCRIGAAGPATSLGPLFQGYIGDLRIVKGQALYTSNFVPPAAPIDPVRNTVLLLRGTAAGVYDSTMNNNLETVGDARINTSITRFASRPSIFFDGAGDRLIVPSSPNFDFPADFTIEMWINFTNVTSTWEAIISRAYGVAGGWRLYKNDANNQLRWYSNLTSVVLTSGSTLANNTWSHIAVVRNSGTITIYIDGVARGSAANSTSYTPGNYALEIGEGVVTSAYPFEGYIQDLRITNGLARYTANFTAPTGPFIQY